MNVVAIFFLIDSVIRQDGRSGVPPYKCSIVSGGLKGRVVQNGHFNVAVGCGMRRILLNRYSFGSELYVYCIW